MRRGKEKVTPTSRPSLGLPVRAADKAVSRPQRTLVRDADILLVYSDADKLMKFKDHYGLKSRAEERIDDKRMSAGDVMLIEALIPPSSRMEGRTLKGSNFRRLCAQLVLRLISSLLKEKKA